MAMKLVKKTAEYKIFVRGDERFAVQDSSGKPVNGEEKVRILVDEELIKVTVPAPKEEAPAEEAPAEDNAAEPEPEVPAEESESDAEVSAGSKEDEKEETK